MELIGLFWLPDHEENRVAGLLRFSDHETSILETDQAFQDNPKEFPFIGRIIGKCSNTNITLDNCSYKSRCIGSNSLIRCNFTFIGDHYVNSEDITLRQLTFSINGLNEWLNLNGFNTNKSIKTLDDDHLLIEYRMPKPIHVPISDDLSLNFFFGYESDSLSNSRTIRQIPRIEITSQKDISFHEFLNLAYRIGNFIAFALNTSTCIDEIRGYRFERNGLKRPQPIDLFFKDQFQNHKTPINHWHIRFRYQDIKPALSTTLIRWLRYYEIARSALDVYFIYKSGGYPFINTQFLSLCQALEGLHKTTCESTAMPKERFDTLKKILLENCPDKESEEWLARRLYNDPSLKERLTETLLPFKDLFGSDQLCKQLVRKTVTLRNNMTHNNSTDRPQNASQILLLVKNLELLFQLRLLQIIGFDVRQINAITSNTISKELRHIN